MFMQRSKEFCSSLGSGGLTMGLHSAVGLVCVSLLTKRQGKMKESLARRSNSSSASVEASSTLLSYQVRPHLCYAQLAFLDCQLPSSHLTCCPFIPSADKLLASLGVILWIWYILWNITCWQFGLQLSNAEWWEASQLWPEAFETTSHRKSFPSELSQVFCLSYRELNNTLSLCNHFPSISLLGFAFLVCGFTPPLSSLQCTGLRFP